MTKTAKKLIEVALPLEAINKASAREKSIRYGHPSTLHLWWSRKPLATARAVLFAQMVDDPSAHPDLFPTEKAQEKERKRLFKIIEDLVQWENTNNETVLQAARDEIWATWRRTCATNADHPQAKELFDRYKLPAFHDPFAGGGSLPLEAQRLGLEVYASDLNPVAVMINKAMIELPPKFAGMPPVNPGSRADNRLIAKDWRGAQGLAEDVRYYGKWMRDEAEKRIGHLYPKVEISAGMAADRPDLKPLVGRKLTVVAWLWSRTVKSPNPAFAHVNVPLASTFILSAQPGREVYAHPVVGASDYSFTVKACTTEGLEQARRGTKLSRGANFQCLMSNTPISGEYIKAEAMAGRMGARLMAIVADVNGSRVYLPPTPDVENAVSALTPGWKPDSPLPEDPRNIWVLSYGMTTYSDLFTRRQLVMLTTYSDLVGEARELAARDVAATEKYGEGLTAAYADAIATYLAFAVDKVSDYSSSLVVWSPTRDQAKTTFSRQALPMMWDHAEVNVFADAAGDIAVSIEGICRALAAFGGVADGSAQAKDAQTQTLSRLKVVSTDPPYYDNVTYANLSDFFYVWLRHSLRTVYPDVFGTLVVPKAEELIADPYRHGSKEQAETFFLNGMTQSMRRLVEQTHPAFPVTVYYAFKQSETTDNTLSGAVSTGWDTFLEGLVGAGFTVTGTWPMRTERASRSKSLDTNALASSIVLVCHRRPNHAVSATRREFISALKSELPAALSYLQRSNIAPVDLAQAAIGPGMAVFTRYSQVLDAAGKPLTVREALALINQVLDETLAEQEGDFDSDTRWALAWFEQMGFSEGEYGVAETLSKAKNTSVAGMVEAGILSSSRGKVRLLRPEQLLAKWDPATDSRLTAWESVHHLVRTLEEGGESAAAEIVAKLGSRADTARELAYRLYNLCERKKRAAEALSYNALVQSWPEIVRLAETAIPRQERLI